MVQVVWGCVPACLCTFASATQTHLDSPVLARVCTDGVEDLLLLLLHLNSHVEAPTGPAVHLCQQYWLNVFKAAILQHGMILELSSSGNKLQPA